LKRLAVLALTLLAANGRAATAYVTDELTLGVYTEQNGQGQRLTTLHSGAVVESLTAAGDYTQVRLADGLTGWVKTTYLTSNEPATVRLKQVQDELDRMRATAPGLAEAAEHTEVERLQREVAALQAARPVQVVPVGTPATAPPHLGASFFWVPGLAVIGGLIAGFCAGYTTLARRIKHRFGGIKVY
jgi:hypothetical protein